MNAVQSVLSSPRFSKILFWIGVAVLAAGLALLIVKLASRGSSSSSTPAAVPSRQQVAPSAGERAQRQALRQQSTIKSYAKVDPRAKQALNTFIASAVARKHMAASYKLAAPAIRRGYTLKKWMKGTIPVLFYPVDNFPQSAVYHLRYGVEDDLLVDVDLIAAPKARQKPLTIRVELKRIGSGAERRWLVSYLQPLYTPLLPIN